MSKSWNRMETWLALFVVGVGVGLVALLGLHAFMTGTAAVLHPEPQRVPSVTHTPPPQQWLAAIDRARAAVRAGIAEQNLPGLSVAVGAGGDLVWAEGFGWADLERQTPVEPDVRFRIGTASTALTSAAVGLLLEQGRLKLDDEIQRYVPEFPKKPWPVTVRHVMGHLAGIVSDGGDEGALLSQHCERPVDALEAFADRALRFEPGTQYQYSRYGWIVVSAAVEAVTGEPFLRFMRDEVFEPLGMDDTTAGSAAERTADRATSYFPRYAAEPRYGLQLMREVDHSCYAGGGGFVSTPSDLVRFSLALERGALLKSGTLQLLRASQRLPSGEETGYGLGWDLEDVTLAGEPTRTVGHDGDLLGGMVASLMTFPDRGIVVAVMSNISYADTPALALSIAQAFAQQEMTTPQ